MDILSKAGKFNVDYEPVSYEQVSAGHINDTYTVTDASGKRYILQRINTDVMKNPPLVMENIAAVTSHLRKKDIETVRIISPRGGGLCIRLEDGWYRMYDFVEGASCYLMPESSLAFKSAGAAFGGFIEALSDMPLGEMYITLKASHNTSFHLSCLAGAIREDPVGRCGSIKEDISLAMSKRGLANIIGPLMASGELPLRVVHNDTKYSNIMIDSRTHKARCILDLDNVMTGTLLGDYGDSIRSGCDMDGVFNKELMDAYTEGFLSAVSVTKKELELMPVAPLVITYENAIRYLTDYIEGDVYFKTLYPGENLDKFRLRMKLLADMEKKLL